jgi:hypothetical protein
MDDLFLVGARAKKDAHSLNEWHMNDLAVVKKFSLKNKKIISEYSYRTPAEFCPDFSENPSFVFKAGHLYEGKLYLCTNTEILIIDADSYEVLNHISLPIFNDLHHVHYDPKSDSLYVAITGLDAVAKITLTGDVLKLWSVLDGNVWDRFDQEIDYRKILTTKPHHSHPNYIFKDKSDVWVTRLIQKDARCLSDRKKLDIRIDVERPHDGVVFGNKIYFTTVDGHVVVVDNEQKKVSEVINLSDLYETDEILGWCRSIKVLDDGNILVGFSRIRPTKTVENLNWLKYRLKKVVKSDAILYNSRPTRVICFNPKTRTLNWEFNLEDCGMNSIYSIL